MMYYLCRFVNRSIRRTKQAKFNLRILQLLVMFNIDMKNISEPYYSLSPDDKDSFFYSKMCTNITATNLESFNSQNINKNDNVYHQNRQKQNYFSKKIEIAKEEEDEDGIQNQTFEKLNQLSQKSSRMMSLFPGIGSRLIKGNSLMKIYPQSNFATGEDHISNKLKIIRNLQDKITQLQLNISNPNVGSDYIGTIQKEINLNFQNYYHQSNQNTSTNKIQLAQLSASRGDSEVMMSEDKSNLFPLTFNKKNQSPIEICVFVPKIIEIQVPVTVIRPRKIFVQDCQSSEDWRKQLGSQKLKLNKNSKSKSENGQKKNSSGSSIQNIINQFTKRINYDYNQKEGYKNEPDIIINFTEKNSAQSLSPISHSLDEKQQFNLPLDSFEKGCGNLNFQRQYAIKRTDRSNMSSYSELQKIRDQFWNKDCLQFNQEYLSQVKQTVHKSNNQSFFESHKDLELDSRQEFRQDKKMQTEVKALTQELVDLKQQLSKKTIKLDKLELTKNQLQTLQIQKDAQLVEISEKYTNLLFVNETLNQKLNQKQQEILKYQSIQIQSQDRIKELQKYISNQFQERDCQIHEMMQLVKQKNDEIQQNGKIHLQLKQLLLNKQKQYQAHLIKSQVEICELKEEIQFYKRKMEQEGIHFNIEQANLIRDLIENNNKIPVNTVMQEKYLSLEEELNKEKITSRKSIDSLKKQNQKLSKLAFLSQEEDILLEQSIKTLIQNYNLQLGKKEQEINYLRRTAEEAQIILKQTSNTCQSQVNTISSIKNLLLSDSSITQDQSLHFVYIVNRLIRHLKLYEYNLVRQKQQRLRVTKKLSELNLYIGKSIEKSEKRAEKLQNQNNRYKKQNQQLSSELRKLHSKFNNFKQRIASSQKQTSNIVQLQKEMLQTENKKINQKYKKIKKYTQELQQKILDQFISLGSSPCEHFCSIIYQKEKHQIEDYCEQRSQLKKLQSQIKPQVQASQSQPSKLRANKISLASSVISYTNKMVKILPKAILAPLPSIPSAVTPRPTSLTLDKLLLKRTWLNAQRKISFIIKLVDLCMELVKVNRKLFNLKPGQMLISGLNSEIQIVIKKEYSCVSQEQDEANLLYRAPQVLLGFTQSEASYVWTVGVIIDQIYHQKPFFRKLNDILSRKENYEVRDSSIPLKTILETSLRKKQKQRPSLAKLKQQLLLLRPNK